MRRLLPCEFSPPSPEKEHMAGERIAIKNMLDLLAWSLEGLTPTSSPGNLPVMGN
ncbi:hypothetical protein [Klebsiella aerogenes]|uniref:Uncharacterized protein n=1 Tax=Klebsiella aerogenes TaxID=548 RepID=A0AAP9R1I7_KLEAE|nr:hypothetical protein HV331_25455 [Klebsiella aerogenes]